MTSAAPLSVSPSDRPLDKRELRELVEDLAGRPDEWRDLVAFPDGQRHFVSLRRDEHVDVWLLCWIPGNDTGWHDHDVSSGAVSVISGALKESNPRIGGAHLETIMAAGTSFCFGPEHIHRLAGAADRSVSIHAYSPPLRRMGQYSMDDGVLRRISVGYDEELSPLNDVA
jgi:predicted metal-dependent enzyme (double-stranded beta helix superfamily)